MSKETLVWIDCLASNNQNRNWGFLGWQEAMHGVTPWSALGLQHLKRPTVWLLMFLLNSQNIKSWKDSAVQTAPGERETANVSSSNSSSDLVFISCLGRGHYRHVNMLGLSITAHQPPTLNSAVLVNLPPVLFDGKFQSVNQWQSWTGNVLRK